MKQITGASIILTEGCNLNCSYCYEKQKTPKVMTLETALEAVDFIFKNNDGKAPLSIIWFGGEPLLNFPVLSQASKYSTEKAKKEGRSLDQLVITNGTIWNGEIEEFFRQNPHIRLQLSWDGMPKYQDKERGKSEVFEATLERAKTLPNSIYAHVQVSPTMAVNLLENVDYIAEKMGDKMSVTLRSVSEIEGWLEEGVLERYREQMFLVYEKYGEKIDRVRNCEFALRSAGTCGAGKLFASISPDGELYACHRFYLAKRRDFKMGTLKAGFEESAKAELLEEATKDNVIGCTECEAYESCDRCLAANYSESGDVLLPTESNCAVEKSVFFALLNYNKVHRPWLLAYQPRPISTIAELPKGMTAEEALVNFVFPLIAEKEAMIRELDDKIGKLEAKVEYYEKSKRIEKRPPTNN